MFYKETRSETNFRNATSFFHLYSSPLEVDLLYRDDAEFIVILNIIALVQMLTHCRILAFAVMSNHLHFILEGTKEECMYFFESLLEKLDNYYQHHGRAGLTDSMKPGCNPINSLEQLRNEIAYVIRNPFVVRNDVNLFACPMTSGYLYFNPMMKKEGAPANTLKGRALRDFTRTRKEIKLSGDVYVKDGMAQAWSFVDYERAMSFYDDARQFIMLTLKNVEAQVEVALRYNEKVLLNDQELFSVTMKMIREQFGCEKLSELNRQQKSTLAVALKNRYQVSNSQIARVCRLSLNDVNALFPLATKLK